jgi:hypothetical protein
MKFHGALERVVSFLTVTSSVSERLWYLEAFDPREFLDDFISSTCTIIFGWEGISADWRMTGGS